MNLPGTSAHASPHHHISRVSILSPFPDFTTSNLPTLCTILAYLHFKLPNKDIPFAFRSYPPSLNVLFSFSLIFAPSPSLWALLPTIHTYPVPHLYVHRHPFVRTSLVVCTDIVSCLYVPSRVEVRTFSINPLKYSYRLFKGFV